MFRKVFHRLAHVFTRRRDARLGDVSVELSDASLRRAVLILISQHHRVCAPFETFIYDLHNVRALQLAGEESDVFLGSFRVIVLPLRVDATTESPMDLEKL